MYVRQITAVDIVGPKADEFLLKVQKAVTGPPWYMESPAVVWSQYYIFFQVRFWKKIQLSFFCRLGLFCLSTTGARKTEAVIRELRPVSTTAALRVANDSQRQLAICRASQRCDSLRYYRSDKFPAYSMGAISTTAALRCDSERYVAMSRCAFATYVARSLSFTIADYRSAAQPQWKCSFKQLVTTLAKAFEAFRKTEKLLYIFCELSTLFGDLNGYYRKFALLYCCPHLLCFILCK